MGGKGGGNEGEALEEMAQQLFDQTDPLRQGLIDNSAAFLGFEEVEVSPGTPGTAPADVREMQSRLRGLEDQLDRSRDRNPVPGLSDEIATLRSEINTASAGTPGTDPVTELQRTGPIDATRSHMFSPMNDAISQRGQSAEGQIMAALPAGGGLTEALANNITSTNAAQAALPGQIIDSELNRAFSLATGAPLQASTSLASNAAGLQANAANQASANAAGAKQGIGVGVGTKLATKGT